ncbi:MAG: hypothetical protein AB1589_39495 [Cyanobacteriota bacterium]
MPSYLPLQEPSPSVLSGRSLSTVVDTDYCSRAAVIFAVSDTHPLG